MKKMSTDFKYVSIAACIATLGWFLLDARSVRQALSNFFTWTLLFAIVLIVTGEYFDKDDKEEK